MVLLPLLDVSDVWPDSMKITRIQPGTAIIRKTIKCSFRDESRKDYKAGFTLQVRQSKRQSVLE
jgi:uncharacterized protein YqfB (UPF0267 family)